MPNSTPNPEEVVALTNLMNQFFGDREDWLATASKRASKVKRATHIPKGIHPSAKGASSVYLSEPFVKEESLLGTHTLSGKYDDDYAIENAPDLNIVGFLKLSLGGRTLLERCRQSDAALQAALSSDPDAAQFMMAQFASIEEPSQSHSAHSFLRQVYMPISDNGTYHLLIPLFPTTLAHELFSRLKKELSIRQICTCSQETFKRLKQDNFSEAEDQAYTARKEGTRILEGFRKFSKLTVQTLGGARPLNVSQLNSQRKGTNYHLASVPPIWSTSSIKPPMGHESVFNERGAFGGRRTHQTQRTLFAKFLKDREHENNVHLREEAKAFVDELITLLLEWSVQVQALPPGWSLESKCRLNPSEKRWLDPIGQAQKEEQDKRGHDNNLGQIPAIAEAFAWLGDTPLATEEDENTPSTASEVARHFSQWLVNGLNKQGVPVGEGAGAYWKKQLWKELVDAQSLQD